jgi:hypothetical protein
LTSKYPYTAKTAQGITHSVRALADKVVIDDRYIHCHLKDGRTIIVPIDYYTLLAEASTEERQNFEILGEGSAISWPGLDLDLPIWTFLEGGRD